MPEEHIFYLYIAFAAVVGIAIGYFTRMLLFFGKKGSIELEVKQILLNAKEAAKNILSDAQKKSDETREKAEKEFGEFELRQAQIEERLLKKEELLDKRQMSLDADNADIREQTSLIERRALKLEKQEEALEKKLTNIASMTKDEAEKELIETISREREQDIIHRIHKLDVAGGDRYEYKAKDILASVIQRLSTSVANETTSSLIEIEGEEIKGKIIGKEGRNIKTFEKETGVELVIDETPNTILISSFDSVRREVARRALERLIKDGRIQPARIEEEVRKAQEHVNTLIKEKGEEAVYECGIYNLDSRITSILGRLHFRTSYGQNVLTHSIEVSHLAGMIAEEVGVDVMTAKVAGLVHDIGKALDHESQGTHVEIGKRILQKFGAKEEVIQAMQSHHEEYPYETIESRIVQVADAISASRPGARKDNVDEYLKRLEELESLAKSFDGVEKAYAVHAGKEIRVFVSPDDISDLEALTLSQDIARKIERELRYPGEVKVTVIRESRTIEYAR